MTPVVVVPVLPEIRRPRKKTDRKEDRGGFIAGLCIG